MNSKERVKAQTEIRHKILANGYTPLANENKACYLEGWSKLDVTPELIDSWAGMLAYQSTGIRIDPPLVAIDIDIDDAGIVGELWVRCCEEFGPEWEKDVLIRTGGGFKETWLCRVDEPFHTPPGPKYVRPGEDPANKELDRHKVELFGGSSGRQIGSFGTHTPGERAGDAPIREYGWNGRSPADVPVSELPVLSQRECFQIVTWASEMLEAAGWVRDRAYNPDDYKGGAVFYDLTDEMTFNPSPGLMVPYAELGSYSGCRMLEITGEGTNRSRGRVYTNDEGMAWVWDSETHAKHLHSSQKPRDTADLFSALGDKLRGVLGPQGLAEGVEQADRQRERARIDAVAAEEPEISDLDGWGEDDWEELVDYEGVEKEAREWMCENDIGEADEARVIGLFEGLYDLRAMSKHLLRRYAYNRAGGSEEAYDILSMQRQSLKNLKNDYARMVRKVPSTTPTGKLTSKTVHAVDLWLSSPDRIRLSGFSFDPGNPKMLVDDEGDNTAKRLNVYRPRKFTVEPDPRAVDVFEAFVEHLFPDERERDWFVNHLAHKVQNPGQRGQCVIMISSRGRVGRGTFNQILRGMFDERFVKNLRTSDIVGQSARWTAWQENCLLAIMDELTPNPLDKQMRLGVASVLDDIVDTRPMMKALEDKGRPLFNAMVHWTGYFSTNHFNAVALPPKDQRFTVLTNTEVRIGENPELKAKLETVQDGEEVFTEAFLCGVYEYLMGLETDRESFMLGIETEAKIDMIESNEGQVAAVLRHILDVTPAEQTHVWLDNLIWEVEHTLVNEYAKMQAKTEVRKLLEQGFAGWTYNPRRLFRVVSKEGENWLQTHVRKVVTRANVDERLSPEDRAEMLGECKVLRITPK